LEGWGRPHPSIFLSLFEFLVFSERNVKHQKAELEKREPAEAKEEEGEKEECERMKKKNGRGGERSLGPERLPHTKKQSNKTSKGLAFSTPFSRELPFFLDCCSWSE
jgi:hypothetical protein